MRWLRKKERKQINEWHRWFAWYPVIIGQVVKTSLRRPNEVHYVKCWLCYIERKGEYWSSWGSEGWDWEYREIERKCGVEPPKPWPRS